MARHEGERRASAGIAGLSYRTLGGIALAVLSVVFIALNRDETEISFIVFTAETALWIALTLSAGAGFVAGFLFGRRHYRA